MALRIWERLSLRWQTAVAVLVPCLSVALFASLYFPARLNAVVEGELERRAVALGRLASAEIGPNLRLIQDGLAMPEDLDFVLKGLADTDSDGGEKDVVWAGVVSVPQGATEVVVTDDARLVLRGSVPPGRYQVPESGCLADSLDVVRVRCLAQSGEVRALFVAAFSLQTIARAREEHQRVGVLSLFAAFGGGLFLALFFSDRLVSPLRQVTRAAKEVAEGDVTVSAVKVSAGGEIRSMAASFNEMLENLRNLVGRMVALSTRISTASMGLRTASEDQAFVSREQSAYAQQVSSTFEELTRTADRISVSTEVVEQAAERTQQAVEEARKVVGEVVSVIRGNRDEVKQVADAILKLNADVKQVSKMARLINNIAERSDLLALNAALEGTKAGEIGRGFSLVAAEMRKLAESVSGTAQEIARIVESVQESGSTAVTTAQIGMAASDRGVLVAEQASEVFQRISELANGTTDAARQIAVATRQQQQASTEAVNGARSIAELVHRGVEANNRTTLIASDLQTVAQALQDVTRRFKTEQPEGTDAEGPPGEATFEQDEGGGSGGGRVVPLARA